MIGYLDKNFDFAHTNNCGVSAKTNLLAKPLLAVSQGPIWVRFVKKKVLKKSSDTATLRKNADLLLFFIIH